MCCIETQGLVVCTVYAYSTCHVGSGCIVMAAGLAVASFRDVSMCVRW